MKQQKSESAMILRVDYNNPAHQQALVMLLDEYAQDPMGGGTGLSETVKQSLPGCLNRIEGAFSLIAWVDEQPVALVNCFQSFSTFKCRPLINIHDLMVRKAYRGMGLSTRMLQEVETVARKRGCCKLTLEVLEGNSIARKAYEKFGFSDYELDPATGRALFWEKVLI